MRQPPKIEKTSRPGRRPWFSVRIGGKYHHLGTDARAAKIQYSRLISEHYGGERTGGKPRTIGELIELWKIEHPGYPYPEAIKCYAKHAGLTELEEITHRHLRNYLRTLQEGWSFEARGRAGTSTGIRTGKYSAWSLRRRVGLARRMLLWAQGEGWLATVPPLPDMPSPVRQARDVDPAVLKQAIAKLPARVALLLRFQAETGCRPSEATHLRWSGIDQERGLAVLTEHKTVEKTKTVKPLILPPGAQDVLVKCRRIEGIDWVFPSRLGKPYTISGIRSILRRHKIDITPYQLRHTFAQWMADSGISVDDIAGFLGHADSRTTRFYATIRAERLRRVARSLNGSLLGAPPNGLASSG